jgi:hypothetical protein
MKLLIAWKKAARSEDRRVNCVWTSAQPASEGSGRFIGMVDNFMDILVSQSKIGLPIWQEVAKHSHQETLKDGI